PFIPRRGSASCRLSRCLEHPISASRCLWSSFGFCWGLSGNRISWDGHQDRSEKREANAQSIRETCGQRGRDLRPRSRRSRVAVRDTLKRKDEVPCRLKAAVRIFLQAVLDDPIELDGEIRVPKADPRRFIAQDRGEFLCRTVPVEGGIPGCHFVEDASEGKDV